MSLQELLHLMKSLGEGLSEKTLAQVQAVAEPDADGQVRERTGGRGAARAETAKRKRVLLGVAGQEPV